MFNIIYILFGLLLLSPLSGELLRIQVFGFSGLLLDLVAPLVIGVWLVDKLLNDRVLRIGKIGRVLVIFIGVLISISLIGYMRFGTDEVVSAGIYLARFLVYLLVPFVVFDLCQRSSGVRFKQVFLYCFGASAILLSLFGFLQLLLFPSFLELGMEVEGWDPHIGRLLSTWFDPNFVAGFFSFALAVFFALCIHYYREGQKRWFWLFSILSFVVFLALYLTYSRSGYLAFLVALFVLALLKSRKLLVAGALVALLAFIFSPRIQERAAGALDSAKSVIGLDSQKPLDPTAQLRVQSWGYAEEIIRDHPLLGIGYGRYKYEINARGYGLLSDHAAGGSDSSLLTIWALSGLFGLLAYLWIWVVSITLMLRRAMEKKGIESYLNAGFLAGSLGLFFHAIFVNSLLFPPIMVYWLVGLGMVDEK